MHPFSLSLEHTSSKWPSLCKSTFSQTSQGMFISSDQCVFKQCLKFKFNMKTCSFIENMQFLSTHSTVFNIKSEATWAQDKDCRLQSINLHNLSVTRQKTKRWFNATEINTWIFVSKQHFHAHTTNLTLIHRHKSRIHSHTDVMYNPTDGAKRGENCHFTSPKQVLTRATQTWHLQKPLAPDLRWWTASPPERQENIVSNCECAHCQTKDWREDTKGVHTNFADLYISHIHKKNPTSVLTYHRELSSSSATPSTAETHGKDKGWWWRKENVSAAKQQVRDPSKVINMQFWVPIKTTTTTTTTKKPTTTHLLSATSYKPSSINHCQPINFNQLFSILCSPSSSKLSPSCVHHPLQNCLLPTTLHHTGEEVKQTSRTWFDFSHGISLLWNHRDSWPHNKTKAAPIPLVIDWLADSSGSQRLMNSKTKAAPTPLVTDCLADSSGSQRLMSRLMAIDWLADSSGSQRLMSRVNGADS